MVVSKQKRLSQLIKNFVVSQEDLEMAFIYSRDGLLMAKSGKIKESELAAEEIDEIHGAISAQIEGLLERISTEYKIGNFGTGSFETPDHRIIYLEAGPNAILLCVCSYDTDLNKLFTLGYLTVEKIAEILEDSFDPKYQSLDIPDLKIADDYTLKLSNFAVDHSEMMVKNVKMRHHIQTSRPQSRVFKLIILGSEAVGKTTLVNSFLKNEKILDYRPTLGAALSNKDYYLQGFKDDKIKFLIYDLAGQEFFKRVRHDYYEGANCAFIVYDVTRRRTFDEAINFWYKDAKKELGDIPFVLVGNKIDLEDQRVISKEEGFEISEEIRSLFIETSALENINVQDAFKLIGIGLVFKSMKDRV
ncbi:MAG: GTP-binding protein [Promethearchaeia archaeon]